jgi:hypothetical protein
MRAIRFTQFDSICKELEARDFRLFLRYMLALSARRKGRASKADLAIIRKMRRNLLLM